MITIGVNGRFLAAPVSGVQRFAREVTARLAARAHVTLHVPANAAVPESWRERMRVLPGRGRGQLWEQVELPGRARAAGDVLFCPANTAPLRGAGLVVMVHDLLPLTHPQWFSRRFAAWYGHLVPRVVRAAAHLLTSSPGVARALRGLLGSRPTPVTVVPQGAEPFAAPLDADATTRTLHALGIETPYVLALGAGDPRKNVAFAIDVVRHYARTAAPLVLVAAGSAASRVHGRHAPPAAAGVLAVGNVDDATLHALYTGASALLYPTLGEGFGRPPLEALCCGTPVLASEYAEGEQLLVGHGAMRLPLHVETWSSALCDILAGGERPDATMAAGLRARWSWDAAADAVLAACHAAAAASGRPAVPVP